MKFKTDNKDNKFWQLREQAARQGYMLHFDGKSLKPLVLRYENKVICRKKTYSQIEQKLKSIESEQTLVAA